MLLDQDAALRAAELVDDTMFYREGHRRLFRAMRRPDRAAGRHRSRHPARRAAAAGRARVGGRVGVPRRAGRRGTHRRQSRVPRADRPRQGDSAPPDRGLHRNHYRGVRRAIAPPATCSTSPNPGSSRSRSSERDEGFTRLKEMLWPTMERIETLQRSGKAITGVPSGFVDLDDADVGISAVRAGRSWRPVPPWARPPSASTSRPTPRPRGRGSPSSRSKCPRKRWSSACSRPRPGWTAIAVRQGIAPRYRLHPSSRARPASCRPARSGSTTHRR